MGSYGPGSGHSKMPCSQSWPWTLGIGSAGAARCASGNVCASGKLSRLKVSSSTWQGRRIALRWLVIIDTQSK
jgi:hypothetical protein